MEKTELIIFNLISNGGNAKGLVYEALKSAEEGDFDQAQALLDEADEFLKVAHQTQTDLLHQEAQGQHHELSILFVHAQDHLMTALEVRSMADGMIRLYKRLAAIEAQG
ncbi:PTS lactose/cellobiose transporter subunit IIA [Vaginisenegalia massiliensis]|uniref:PTS lactose/cellobiose transporter subunit IIA n=1 Tax=Vaginisenegalia massiliensis TaxID=2058294 RepID=UPI000F534ACD|nr:PTS lactose/cellobiose transporter subunit IIA [Vaginisenegalia massiliensis]